MCSEPLVLPPYLAVRIQLSGDSLFVYGFGGRVWRQWWNADMGKGCWNSFGNPCGVVRPQLRPDYCWILCVGDVEWISLFAHCWTAQRNTDRLGDSHLYVGRPNHGYDLLPFCKVGKLVVHILLHLVFFHVCVLCGILLYRHILRNAGCLVGCEGTGQQFTS